MKTRVLIGIILIAVLLSGCAQVQAIKDQYVATRVAQELTKMPAVTEAPKEATPAVVETAETPEVEEKETPETETQEPTLEAIPSKTPEPTATATLVPTPTSSSLDPAVYLGAPTWVDTFDTNREIWSTDTDEYLSAWIGNGFYHLTARNKIQGWRIATTHQSLSDFYLEMTFVPGACKPGDKYGMIFRVPVENNPNQGYLLGLNCAGEYSLRKWDGTLGAEGVMTSLLAWKADANILKGADKTNRLGVMAIGSRFIIYINGVKITETTDSAYPQGFFGVFAGLEEAQGFVVKLDRAAVWSNPVER